MKEEIKETIKVEIKENTTTKGMHDPIYYPDGDIPALKVEILQTGVNGGSAKGEEKFVVPYGKDEEGNTVSIIAVYTFEMYVDDWGSVSLDGKMILDLTKETGGEEAGQHGGHQLWNKECRVEVPSGEHVLSYEATNIDIPHAQYNNFVCQVYGSGIWKWMEGAIAR